MRQFNSHRLNPTLAKRGVAGSVIVILILTVLEFPPPIGFETRPQSGVSPFWLVLFLAILASEIAAIPLIFKRPELGAKLAIVAAVLNIFQIAADQLHLMQPEVAPLGYSMLEYSVGLFALTLTFFAWRVRQEKQTH
jgi:hypothetical protein